MRGLLRAPKAAFMLQAVPGCYLLLGAGRAGNNPGLHSSPNVGARLRSVGVDVALRVPVSELQPAVPSPIETR